MIPGKRGSQERFNWWANLVIGVLFALCVAGIVYGIRYGDWSMTVKECR